MKLIPRIAVSVVLFTFALALAAPAEAHERRDRRHRIEHRHHGHLKQQRRFDRRDRRVQRSYRYDRFDVPRRIHDHRRHEYRSYFEGSVYFAPHRHRHAVYLFPVRVGGGWSHREHYYCEDELFFDRVGFEYRGPRFSIRIGR